MEAALPDSKSPDSQTYTHKSAIETINTTTLTVLLAAVYVATGYLGTLLAIPPGNVSILWPPSGIAMAAMLVCGPRASLGILLGAIIVNGQAFFDSGPIADQIPAIIAALTIGIGSVLQPLAGRYLIIKFSNSDDPFKDGGTILKSGGLFAVTCLISSNIGSQSLVLTGIADGPAFSIFQTWWLGDFIGVMVFAPLFLAIFKQSRVNAATLVLATVISFGGTFYVSEQVRGSAEDAWDTSATREAERLTTTLVSWLETAISPINSIGALFESSDDVFEDEFLEASIRLEDFQPDFFPSVLSIVATIPGAGAENNWEVLYSTNETGFLTPGDVIVNGGMGSKALLAALDEPGRLVIGEFTEYEDEQVAMAAIAIERSDFEQVAIGMLNLSQMFDGLFAVQVPDGFHVTVDGAGSADNPEELQSVYKHGHLHEASLATKTIRGTSGSAQLTFHWDVTDKFLPGSRTELSNAVLIGGIMGSAVLILFLTFVLGQNAQIRQRVRERTAELDRERAVLQATMEAMDQGLSMFDSELVLTARNNKFMDMLNLPQAVFPIGANIDQMLRHNAENGEYGDGDIDQLVQERVDLASKFEPHRFERQRPDGSYLEIRGNPLPNGEGFVTTYTDITERKLAEQEIAEKQAALRMTLDNMPGGICMLDGDLNIQVVNDKYCELYGHDPEVYRVGRPIREVVSINVEAGMHAAGDHVSDSAEETIQQRMSAFRSGVAGESERELPNGRTLHIRHNPIDGGGVVLVATDISDRKQAELEIATKQAQLTDIIENVQQAVILWDTNQKPIIWNDKVAAALAIDPEYLEDKDFDNRDLAEMLAKRGNYGEGDPKTLAAERLKRLWAGPARSEFSFDGERTFDVQSNITPDGRLVVTYTDISERIETQREIAEKEAQLRMALDNMPGAMVVANPDLDVVLINEAYKDYYGDPDGLVKVGTNMADLLASEVKRGILSGEGTAEQILADRIRGYRESIPLSTVDSTLDGRAIQLVRKPIEGGYTISVAVDITELKKTERELASKEALLSAALENMTGGLFMIDAALKLRVFNDRMAEIYELPENTLGVGVPLRNVLRVRAERGEYGPGDPADLVKDRLEGYRNRDVQIVTDRVGDKIVEVYRAPMEDGGMVCVFNDVTERKRAEEELNKAHSLITESLTYASRIQRSLLPPKTILEEVFRDHCVIWEPTATVGGDMVWLRPAADGFYLIVADCTGHGPPGAFMTMICTGALDQALAEIEAADPAEVLRHMNQRIKTALGQDSEHGESDDGVELGVCHINSKSQTMIFAGARFSLEIIENKEMTEVKGNKSAIGYRHVPNDAQFDNHTLSYNADMQFYMWTDGMVDQIGGPKRRSFGKRRLRKIIMDYSQMGMSWQRSQILREFEDYQHTEGRRDDITMVGFVPRKS